MTVDELRRALADLPGDMPVMHGDRDYIAISAGSAYTSSAKWVPDSGASQSLDAIWPPGDSWPVAVFIVD